MNANYWSLIQNAAGDRFACQREGNALYETGQWHPTAEAAVCDLDQLNEQAEKKAEALELLLPDHLR